MDINKWLTKIREGDKESFQHLYNTYAPSAIRTAYAITRHDELAKDAVQETFIRVYRNIDTYKPERPFAPWFYQILTNECMRMLKKESMSSKVNFTDAERIPALSVEAFDELSILYNMIQLLEDIHRIPLILKYVEGFTEKEIADILSLNQNTVKSRLYKGRNKLKKTLDEADWEAR